MLDKVRLALRVSTRSFDAELVDLIAAALADLALAGITMKQGDNDPLIVRAVVTYCRAHFGEPDNYDKLKAAYDEQKAQLSTAGEYTDWGLE